MSYPLEGRRRLKEDVDLNESILLGLTRSLQRKYG
jgi:hypothetical protein